MINNTQPEITLLRSKVEGELRANSKNSRCYLTLSEKKDMQQEYGEPAYILYDYLLDMTKHRNPDVTVPGLMAITGWTHSKVKRIRKILLEAELLYTIYLASTKGSKITLTYLGKNLVKMAKRAEEVKGEFWPLSDLTEDQKKEMANCARLMNENSLAKRKVVKG